MSDFNLTGPLSSLLSVAISHYVNLSQPNTDKPTEQHFHKVPSILVSPSLALAETSTQAKEEFIFYIEDILILLLLTKTPRHVEFWYASFYQSNKNNM